ncbi:diguanylate cyclase [uncultured Anaerovibrio sp.]|uniref:sensor domain-containing diguanylate cyclase n=1 Tax=uncultured Anaerovibrio sp. TaxID=361586 RepID=UPI002633E398|nr:diguanylate cyclase [uncultured Anaerovibrio sp.]
MKHIPYLCDDINAFYKVVDEFADTLPEYGDYSCILATIFVDIKLKGDTPMLLAKLKEVLPDVKVIGGTAHASITEGEINYYGISVTFSVFSSSTVEVLPVHWEDEHSKQIGEALYRKLIDMRQLVAVGMYSSGYALNMVPFFNILSQLPTDIIFFGGIVVDGTVGVNGFVFTSDEVIERGHVVVAFKGKSLQAHIGYGSGWRPLGKVMRITRLNDANTVSEIDNVPVREIYERYLGISQWDESFIKEAVVFPFSLSRGGMLLSRLPRSLCDDGSACYGADFVLGEKVRLCYGDPDFVIYEARALLEDMVRFQPEGVFAVSCWARQVLLHKNVNEELEACRKSAASTGIYAWGEYVRSLDGGIYMNNMCLSIIGLREGGITTSFYESKSMPTVRLERRSGIVGHLMHFVQAVSSELEESNKRLHDIAKIDFLTNLLNRGELESEMKNSLYDFQLSDGSMTLLMLDIDNFKGINDTLGHDIGDSVLKSVAALIKQNIRSTDIAGRWGGDEFIIVFNNCDVRVAENVAERIRSKIMGLASKLNVDNVTVSIGITAATKKDTLISLFQRVDAAMYKSKIQGGKNCITVT